jgi:hypothetical protein
MSHTRKAKSDADTDTPFHNFPTIFWRKPMFCLSKLLIFTRIRIMVAAFALLATGAQAAMVAIDNPGFEAQVHGPNTFTFGAPTGWDDYNTGVVSGDSIGTLNPQGTTYFAPGQWGGSNVAIAFMQSGGTSGVEFGIRQTLDVTLQADTTYTLTVGVGNIASGSSDLGNGPIFFDLDGFPGYRVELLAGNTLLAADLNSLASGGNTIPEGEFRNSQVWFDSTGVDAVLIGQPLVIGLVNLNVPDLIDLGADREVDFDDITLDASATVIPIPPTILLLGSGVGLLILQMRRGSGSPRS